VRCGGGGLSLSFSLWTTDSHSHNLLQGEGPVHGRRRVTELAPAGVPVCVCVIIEMHIYNTHTLTYPRQRLTRLSST
jgi:hypothetical protein